MHRRYASIEQDLTPIKASQFLLAFNQIAQIMKIAVFLMTFSLAEAFFVPRPPCLVAPPSTTKLFYDDDGRSSPLSDSKTKTSQLRDEVLEAQSSGDVDDSTIEETITKQDVEILSNIVKGLADLDNPNDFDTLAVNNRDMDVEEYDDVVTPKRTRVFSPLTFAGDLISKIILNVNKNEQEQKKGTESIFKKLSELLDEADQLFDGSGEILQYEKYPNHPEVSPCDCGPFIIPVAHSLTHVLLSNCSFQSTNCRT
jgi:hypothetical protein